MTTNGTSDAIYDSADVARAACVKRATLDSWLLRKLLPLPKGPGTGRSRQYTLLDTVRVAAMANMTNVGLSPSDAGSSVALIKTVPRPGDVLVATFDPVDGVPVTYVFNKYLAVYPSEIGFYQLDLFALLEKVRGRLSNRNSNFLDVKTVEEASAFDLVSLLQIGAVLGSPSSAVPSGSGSPPSIQPAPAPTHQRRNSGGK